MKLLQIYNSAPHYRESIFRLIDSTFDSDYIFGKNTGDIKQMDTSFLKGHVYICENKYLPMRFYWQRGVQTYLRKDYDTYIILGDTRCLSTWLFCIRARLFFPKKRLFFWTHGWYGKETVLERIIKKAFFHFASGGIFLYGNYARDLMIQEGFKPEKLFVIHNSLSYDQQLNIRKCLSPSGIFRDHFNNNVPNLLFVGRLTKVKQLDLILQAMALLNGKGKTYNLTFIGAGTEDNSLKQLADELQLRDNIWFYGPCYDEAELGTLLYNADVCVSPGNVGLTAMHSMVFGTPVITHNEFSLQMPEFEAVIEGKTGAFFKRGDAESLAQAIESWFTRTDYNREIIRRFCFDEIDNNWTPSYQLEVFVDHLQD